MYRKAKQTSKYPIFLASTCRGLPQLSIFSIHVCEEPTCIRCSRFQHYYCSDIVQHITLTAQENRVLKTSMESPHCSKSCIYVQPNPLPTQLKQDKKKRGKTKREKERHTVERDSYCTVCAESIENTESMALFICFSELY